MNLKIMRIISIAIGIVWSVVAIGIGTWFFEFAMNSYGDVFGALSVFYVLVWLAAFFVGRHIIGLILARLTKRWRRSCVPRVTDDG